ncbi:MAG: type IV pilin-like G/H family protein [Xenococcaceae cyanobacterium MO_207.B15]|nr:type IV pilin-like G/H family protein [Xenococcaceae cyanobacterium MO_207.B15]
MNSVFTAKLLQNLRNKKANKGFTLIELLVVVIIIGVLAAVALPNLLGQVGKARETEAKNGVGTINRAQQAYHFERRTFSPDLDDTELATQNALGVILDSEYYTFDVNAAGSADDATVDATPQNADTDGVRAYAGGINHNAGAYTTAVCQEVTIGDGVPTPDPGAACPTGTNIN